MWKRLAVMKLPILAAREYDAVGRFQETLKTKAGQNSIINRIFHLWNLPIILVKLLLLCGGLYGVGIVKQCWRW
jgi:hypothetical protein